MSEYESDVTQASISLWRSAGAAVRVLRRSLRWWLVILLLLFAAWLIADHHTAGLLQDEYASLEAAGEPTTIVELAPTIPPGEQNAADRYLVAFGFLAEHDGLAFDEARADPVFARTYLAPDETALRLLKEAAALDHSAFPTDWTQPGYSLTFPHFARVRESARRLLLEAVVLAESGRPDEALDSIAAAVRIGEHTAREPTLIATLVGVATTGIGLTGLEEVLAVSDPSSAACRDLFDVLGAIDFEPSLRRSLRGERAMSADLFRRIREMGGAAFGPASWDPNQSLGFHPVLLDLYRTVGRPLLNLDELAFVQYMEDVIAVSDVQPFEREARYADLDAADGRFSANWNILSSMIAPVFSRAHMSVLRAHANLAVAQVALAAKAYEARHGRLPSSLDEIVSLGWELPSDPYTGAPLHYHGSGDAFLVWSVGPNLLDDGGTEFDHQQMDWSSGPYDLVFICDGDRVKQDRAEALQRLEEERKSERDRLEREAAEAAQRSARRGGGRRGPR
jgi:hypothetical protein